MTVSGDFFLLPVPHWEAHGHTSLRRSHGDPHPDVLLKNQPKVVTFLVLDELSTDTEAGPPCHRLIGTCIMISLTFPSSTLIVILVP
jgi:hypothetical protein